MKIISIIHPDFASMADLIKQIPESFDTMGILKFSGRNCVRDIIINGYRFAVKSYNRLAFINRYIYYFRSTSKARRSYEISNTLLSKDILTPFPVAYIDYYDKARLVRSFYICLYIDCKSGTELIAQNNVGTDELVKDFAHFSYKLHSSGIYHYDFNLDNVLCLEKSDGYDFFLIDNNRIRIKKFSKREALRNFNRIVMPPEKMDLFVDEYSKLLNEDKTLITRRILASRKLDHFNFYLKKVFKFFFKNPFQLKAH